MLSKGSYPKEEQSQFEGLDFLEQQTYCNKIQGKLCIVVKFHMYILSC